MQARAFVVLFAFSCAQLSGVSAAWWDTFLPPDVANLANLANSVASGNLADVVKQVNPDAANLVNAVTSVTNNDPSALGNVAALVGVAPNVVDVVNAVSTGNIQGVVTNAVKDALPANVQNIANSVASGDITGAITNAVKEANPESALVNAVTSIANGGSPAAALGSALGVSNEALNLANAALSGDIKGIAATVLKDQFPEAGNVIGLLTGTTSPIDIIGGAIGIPKDITSIISAVQSGDPSKLLALLGSPEALIASVGNSFVKTLIGDGNIFRTILRVGVVVLTLLNVFPQLTQIPVEKIPVIVQHVTSPTSAPKPGLLQGVGTVVGATVNGVSDGVTGVVDGLTGGTLKPLTGALDTTIGAVGTVLGTGVVGGLGTVVSNIPLLGGFLG